MKKMLLFGLSLVLNMSIQAQISFGVQDTLSTFMYNANTVLYADIDGDGIKDIIAESKGTGGVGQYGVIVWYKNDGKANFQTADTILGVPNQNMAIGDLDNDGDNDFVYVDLNFRQLILYRNDGSGNFIKSDTVKTYDSGTSIGLMSISIYDMDNDGDMDIISSHYNKQSLIGLENNTIGGGQAWAEHAIATIYANDVFPADIDGDGDVDLAVTLPNSWKVAWLDNNDDGTWTEKDLPNATYDAPWTVFVKDLNNDGNLDILAGSRENSGAADSAQVFWYKNLGNGTFSTKNKIYGIKKGSTPYYQINDVIAVDLNLDGKEDIIAASTDNRIVSIENLGNDKFGTARSITTNVNNPLSICKANIDDVEDIELLSASEDDNKIAYYQNITAIITQQPQNKVSVCVETDSVMFTVKAINVMEYRWQEDYGSGFSDISTTDSHYHGVETDTLYVDAWYANMNGYKYRCRILGNNPALSRDTSGYSIMTVDQRINANANDDENLCETSSTQLSGNNPSPNTGNWTSNIPSLTFDNSSVYNTNAHFGIGAFKLYWTIDNKACGTSVDTMIIRNYQNITANAGSDVALCDTSKYQLHANTPQSPSTGTWLYSDAGLSFNDTLSSDAIVSNLIVGKNTLKWQINNGACGFNSSSIYITRYQTIIADAGDDQAICEQTLASLHGNAPGSQGQGYWVASNRQVIFDNSTYHNTNLSNIPHGQTTFTWTIDIPVCGSSSDEMILSSYNRANIDVQPVNMTVTEGENANFKLKVSGDVESYQWYKDNTLINNDTRISGSKTDSLVILATQQNDAGYYKCVFMDYCYGNENNSDIVQLTVNTSTTGFETLEHSEIKIYPNPNNGVFKILNNSNEQISRLEILNLKGEIIYELEKIVNKTIPINISNYPKGIYLLNINKNDKLLMYRIIVQ
jgi:hypothetical protein